MKIVRTIFFTLLAFGVIIGAAIFIFFQSFNCTQYLSAIEVKASSFLGRPVSIAGAGLGFSLHGLTLDAGPVVVADDPNFTTEPFIEIQRVRVSVDLRDLVFQRKIHIKNVLLDSPEFHFIRSAQGVFNFQSIGQTDQQGIVAGNPLRAINQPKITTALEAVKKSASTSLNIEPGAVEIKDAAISFIDQSHDLPLDIWLNDINARLDDFSLSKPMPVSWEASFYSSTPNVNGQAIVLVALPPVAVTVSDFKFQADFSKLDQAGLEDISPGLSGNPILKSSMGIMQLNIPHLGFEPSSGLDADGDLNISGAVIKNVNVVKLLLEQAMKIFGGLSLDIDNFLGNQSSLAAPDTTILKASADFSIHNQDVTVKDSIIQTNIFELTAKGMLEGGNVDMQTLLHLNQDVSNSLINQFKGLKTLCDDSQRLTIQASLKGTLPHLKYEPTKDFRKKGKKVLIREGLNMLGSFLGGGFLK